MIQENTQSRTSVQSIVHRPILFSGPMVQAILAGLKTQTRRVIKGKGTWSVEDADDFSNRKWPGYEDEHGTWCDMQCPYGKIGDRLWVRETFVVCADSNIFYRADGKPDPWDGVRWKPSIFMPRKASRITLEITGLRVERLNEISESDAKAEGIATSSNGVYFMDYTHGIANACKPEFSFMTLWKSINGPDSWDRNPWVWVVQFRRV